MLDSSKLIQQPYFSHDINSRTDKKIMKLICKHGFEGYGVFWAIVEFMHINDFKVSDEDLIAYELRANVELVHSIMNDFELFTINDDFYISERINKNLNRINEEKEKSKKGAVMRWTMSTLKKAYKKYFNKEPILTKIEIKKLGEYSSTIEDLRELMPDIIFNLKNLKFDNNINFKPSVNWLLKDNNLARLLNGEFGKFKHDKTDCEIKKEQKAKSLQKIEETKEIKSFEEIINSINSKESAIELIAQYSESKQFDFIIPPLKVLMQKFNISKSEIMEHQNVEKR